MPIRKYKPTSPARRQMTVQTFDEMEEEKTRLGKKSEELRVADGDGDPPAMPAARAVDAADVSQMEGTVADGRVVPVLVSPAAYHRASTVL